VTCGCAPDAASRWTCAVTVGVAATCRSALDDAKRDEPGHLPAQADAFGRLDYLGDVLVGLRGLLGQDTGRGAAHGDALAFEPPQHMSLSAGSKWDWLTRIASRRCGNDRSAPSVATGKNATAMMTAMAAISHATRRTWRSSGLCSGLTRSESADLCLCRGWRISGCSGGDRIDGPIPQYAQVA
jgi:hypothetical protein